MSKTNTKTLPTHRIFSVSKSGEDKTNWTEIGAAWKHQDGKGFNLTFTARPLEGAQIVLREPQPQTKTKSKAKSSIQTLGRDDELSQASVTS